MILIEGLGTMLRIGMVADYPPSGVVHSKDNAPYSKCLATSFSGKDAKIVVFANKLNGREEYTEGNIEVVRCWNRGVFYLLQILGKIWRRRTNIQAIHIQHEYFYYGNAFTTILFPLFLLILKSLRKPIILTIHGVISFSQLDRAFTQKNNLKGSPRILKLGLLIITKLICSLSDKVVVHEDYPSRVLAHEYGIRQKKITVIPRGINDEGNKLINREKAKELLNVGGKRVIMFFGYISGYKGLDILIDACHDLPREEYALLIAGDRNPRLQRDIKYQKNIRDLGQKASQSSCEIRFCGFIPEEDLPLYFSAADVVIFPHTEVMGASGTLATTISYRRPFLLSEPFKLLLVDDDLLFRNNPEDLRNKIDEFFSSIELEEKALKYGSVLLQERCWSKVGSKTVALYRQILQQ